jgi:hypothetical protein
MTGFATLTRRSSLFGFGSKLPKQPSNQNDDEAGGEAAGGGQGYRSNETATAASLVRIMAGDPIAIA